MKRITITSLLVACLSTMSVFAQIGVNTATPDPSSALDIRSPNPSDQRGVLLPRMTRSERLAINSGFPPQGLMVFDITDNLFYYFDGAKWNGLVPKQQNNSYPGNPTIKGVIAIDSGSVITPKLNAVNATVDTTVGNVGGFNKLNVPGFSTNALVPTGAIIMWSGNTLPAGWALCDGNEYWANGLLYDPFGFDYAIPRTVTPNLFGKFIVGYNPSSPTTPATAPNDGTTLNYGTIGNKGGEAGHLLSSAESGLPAHNHTTNPHNHAYADNASTNDADRGALSGGAADANESDLSRTTQDATVVVNSSAAQNASVVHENRPPYYVLAYIIKL